MVLGIRNIAVSKLDQDLALIKSTSYGKRVVEKRLDGNVL